tara:strand:+ start:630 stop:1127 length:498 start_codon:yes stop_codon:yes gene_type:complete
MASINNLKVNLSFNNFCKNVGGKNEIPNIILNNKFNINYYALILIDNAPAPPRKYVIHWYIPIMCYNKLNHLIYKINGFNTAPLSGDLGYFGPCPPKNTGIHKYEFILFSLDKKYDPTKEDLNINNVNDFYNILKKHNVNILDKKQKLYCFNSKILNSQGLYICK